MRLAIEPMLIPRAISDIQPEVLDEAQQLCDQMAHIDNNVRFADLNQRFHDLLLVLDSGSWTARIAGILRAAAAPYVALTLRAVPRQIYDSNQDHYKMVEAYRKRDVELAQQLQVSHLNSSLSILEHILQS